MSTVAKLKARIDAGDPARVYLDYYGSHWVEGKSTGLVPWESRMRLSPPDAFELRNSIALRYAVIPPRAAATHSPYRRYRGGWLSFLPIWIASELRDLVALPAGLTGLPIVGSAWSLAGRWLGRAHSRSVKTAAGSSLGL